MRDRREASLLSAGKEVRAVTQELVAGQRAGQRQAAVRAELRLAPAVVTRVAEGWAARIRAEVGAPVSATGLSPAVDPAAVRTALAARARVEREAAILDLAEAAQALARADVAAAHGEHDRAAVHVREGKRLYRRADCRHRLAGLLDPAPRGSSEA
ncbi:MAG: hypothetical protein ACR2LF_07345 [Jatrophihabitantaceae bacterium]